MERWPFHIVDVFTDRPLAGNQLAVFEDASGIPAIVAATTGQGDRLRGDGLSLPAQDGGDARIRIFTPENEIPFAGHPILGTAIVSRHNLGKKPRRPRDRQGAGPGADRTRSGPGDAAATMEQPIPSFARYTRTRTLC